MTPRRGIFYTATGAVVVVAGEAIEEGSPVQAGGRHDEGDNRRVQPSVHPVPDSAVQDEHGPASSQARRRAQGPDRQVKRQKGGVEQKST